MKNVILVFMFLAAFTVNAETKVNKLQIGDKATKTDVKMKCVSGYEVSIEDMVKENGVLVVFSCNTCPFVLRWEGRYPGLKEFAEENGVGMIVLNSNYQKRNGDDSYENMKAHADAKGYNFPYVVDKESKVANAFGGQTTPHTFLLNSDLELVYKGAIDDNSGSAPDVKRAYLKDAITSLGNGKKVALAETQPVGCSIKRKLD